MRHPCLFNIQDDVATMGQGEPYGLRDDERLGRSDTVIILLRKIYEREMRNLMEGRPIKRWRRPAERFVVGHSAQGLHRV